MPRSLTEQELLLVNEFAVAADAIAKKSGIYEDFNIYSIAMVAKLNIIDFPKEGVLIQAIWVKFLSVLRDNMPITDLKYATEKDFLRNYHNCFEDCSPSEIRNLWETANWMNILFRFIPAKKNKGMAIAIVPKLVEGWFAKYVTGSGQKKSTADRVKIFEVEGDVKPNHRGKLLASRRFSESLRSPTHPSLSSRNVAKHYTSKRRVCFKQQRKRQRTSSPMIIDNNVSVSTSDEVTESVPSITDVIGNVNFDESSQPVYTVPTATTVSFGHYHYIGNHDLTDHDTDLDSAENVSSRGISSSSDVCGYQFDFESYADVFFNTREDDVLEIQNPDQLMTCDSDLNENDYAEVFRLLRDTSTPNVCSNGALSTMVSRKSSSPRTSFATSVATAEDTFSPGPFSQGNATSSVYTDNINNGHVGVSSIMSNARRFTTYSPVPPLTRCVSFQKDTVCSSPRSPALSISSRVSLSYFEEESTDDEKERVVDGHRPLSKLLKIPSTNAINCAS